MKINLRMNRTSFGWERAFNPIVPGEVNRAARARASQSHAKRHRCLSSGGKRADKHPRACLRLLRFRCVLGTHYFILVLQVLELGRRRGTALAFTSRGFSRPPLLEARVGDRTRARQVARDDLLGRCGGGCDPLGDTPGGCSRRWFGCVAVRRRDRLATAALLPETVGRRTRRSGGRASEQRSSCRHPFRSGDNQTSQVQRRRKRSPEPTDSRYSSPAESWPNDDSPCTVNGSRRRPVARPLTILRLQTFPEQ